MRIQKISKLLISLSLLLTLVTIAFGQTMKNETLVIADKKVDCSSGAGKQKCLLVSEDKSKTWTYFYNNIEGFSFRDGYTQMIEVSVEKVGNPPADASSLKYKLVKTIRSKKTNGQSARAALASLKKTTSTSALAGQEWMLTEINGQETAYKDGVMRFDEKSMRYSAKVCNNMTGSYKLMANNRIVFANGVSTKKACFGDAGKAEMDFSKALNKVDSYMVKGNSLQMMNGGNTVLKFVSKGTATTVRVNKPLEGTKWALMELYGISIKPGSNIPFLYLDSSKKMASGSTGCNRFSGKYGVAGGNLRLGNLAMTQRACLDKHISSVEKVMSDILADEVRYKIKGATLYLYDNGRVVAKFMSMTK